MILFLSNNHLETIHGLEDYIIFGKHINIDVDKNLVQKEQT